MALLISEMLTADGVLERAIPWVDEAYEYLTSLVAEDEIREHEGRVPSGSEPAWYQPRLSALRQVILGTC